MIAMSESAAGEPEACEIGADRLLRLRTAEGVQTYYLDGPFDDGGFRLVPVVPWESLPEHVRSTVDRGEAHPEGWVRRPRRAG